MEFIFQNSLGPSIVLIPGVFIIVYAIIVRISIPERQFSSLPFVLSLSRILLIITVILVVFVSMSWGMIYDIVLIPYFVILSVLYGYLRRRYRGQVLVTQGSSQLHHDLSTLIVISTLILVFAVIMLYLQLH